MAACSALGKLNPSSIPSASWGRFCKITTRSGLTMVSYLLPWKPLKDSLIWETLRSCQTLTVESTAERLGLFLSESFIESWNFCFSPKASRYTRRSAPARANSHGRTCVSARCANSHERTRRGTFALARAHSFEHTCASKLARAHSREQTRASTPAEEHLHSREHTRQKRICTVASTLAQSHLRVQTRMTTLACANSQEHTCARTVARANLRTLPRANSREHTCEGETRMTAFALEKARVRALARENRNMLEQLTRGHLREQTRELTCASKLARARLREHTYSSKLT